MSIEELIRRLELKIKNIEQDEKSSGQEYTEIHDKEFLFEDDKVGIRIDSKFDLYTLFVIMLREKYGQNDKFPLSIGKKVVYNDPELNADETMRLQHDIVTLIYALASNLSTKKLKTTDDILTTNVGEAVLNADLLPADSPIGEFDVSPGEWFFYRGYSHIEDFFPMIEFISSRMDGVEDIYDLIQRVTIERTTYIRLSKSEKKTFAKFVPSCFKVVNKKIRKYYNDVIGREEKRKQNLQKKKRKYIKAIERLSMESKRDVITDLSIIELIPDEDYKRLVLEYIYDHNKKASDKLEQELVKARSNSIVVYQHLLSETGIILTEESYDKISFRTKEEIEQITKIAKRYGITDSNSIYQMLISANTETFSNIEKLHEKGIISKAFIAKNPTLFTETSASYRNLMNCIKTLKDKDIPYKVLHDNSDVLVVDKKLLEDKLSTLDEYGLTKAIKKSTNLRFLESENLEELLDLVIEYGYGTELNSNLNILNFSKERWLRLSILKELNELPKNTEELEEVLGNPNFIVPDHNIHEYVSIPTEEYEKILRGLLQEESLAPFEKYTKDNLTYDINGILISRRKVERQIRAGNKASVIVNGYQKNKY